MFGRKQVLEKIIDFHQYLNYYPHPEVTYKLIEAVEEKGSEEDFKRIEEIFKNRLLLKVNPHLETKIAQVASKITPEKTDDPETETQEEEKKESA